MQPLLPYVRARRYVVLMIPIVIASFASCQHQTSRNELSGWTGDVTLQQIEDLRSVDALLPLDPDSIATLYRRHDPATFYATYGEEIRSLALLIDSLNAPLPDSLRVDTLSIDHTFSNIGEAAIRGRALYISSSYFYMFRSPEVRRSVATHEFGHRYYHAVTAGTRASIDSAWHDLQRTALFYIFRDGEYAGNARFGGHPEESPPELFASAFNVIRNRPGELASRLLFVSDKDRPVTDRVIAIVAPSIARTRR